MRVDFFFRVVSMNFVIFKKRNLVLKFTNCILKLLILQFKGLQGYNKGVFLLQNSIISLLKLLFLKLVQGLHLILPHHSQCVQLFLYLFVGFYDLLNRLQCFFVLIFVIDRASALKLNPQPTYLLVLISYGCEQLGSTHKSN